MPAATRSFLPKVFGNETRVGDYAKNFSIAGRMLHDPELVFWRNIVRAWSKAHANAKAVSWTALHLPAFPGIQRLRELQADGDAACNEYGKFKAIQAREKAGRAAGRWIRVLSQVLRQVYMARLQHGTKIQRLTFKQLQALKKWKKVLKIGLLRAQEILARLEILTQFRILSKTQVREFVIGRVYFQLVSAPELQYGTSKHTPYTAYMGPAVSWQYLQSNTNRTLVLIGQGEQKSQQQFS